MAARTSVLVVTDDEYVREEVRFGFPSDVDVVFAEDATDARGHLADHQPSLVIVAQRTGNSGAFALARDMSQRTDLAQVPIMILLEREQDEWLARQAGGSWCKAKPLNPGELVADALELLAAKKAS